MGNPSAASKRKRSDEMDREGNIHLSPPRMIVDNTKSRLTSVYNSS
jgi:hypothetical protein